MINPEEIALLLTDTVGAAKILDNCTSEMVRHYVKTDRLRCFLFVDGVFTERQHGENTRGKDLLFLRSDVQALPRLKPGKPKGSKNKTKRVSE